MIQSEPIAAARTLKIFLVDATGAGVAGESRGGGATVQIRKPGGSWTNSSADLTDRSFGAYELVLTQGEVDTVGPLWFKVVHSGTIKDFYDVETVEPLRDAIRYNLAAGGASGSITLDSGAVATDSYYASSSHGCEVSIVAGTGIGQTRLGTGYTGSSKVLTVSPNWVTNPDSTSVYRLDTLTGDLNATVIAAIQSGLATSANQTRILGLLHYNSMIDNTVFGGSSLLTSARLRVFADATALAAATAGHSDNTDSEIARYTITAVDAGSGQYTSYKMTKTL